MKLNSTQLADLDRHGYLFFPALFTQQEMKPLTDCRPVRCARRSTSLRP